MSWSLWNAHNRFQFKHVQTHPNEIFKQADSLLEEYQRLCQVPPGLPHRWNICLRIYLFFFLFFFFFFKFWCFCNNRPIVLWANFNTVKLLGQAFFCIFFWLIYFYHFSPKTPLELVWMLLNQWIVISLQENNNNYSLIYVE